MTQTIPLEIGEYVEGEITSKLDDTNYLVKLSENYEGWQAILVNQGGLIYEEAKAYNLLVFDIIKERKTIYLTDSVFGLYTIPNHLLINLLSSVRAILQFLKNPTQTDPKIQDSFRKQLEDFNKFCGNIFKKNRTDWITIYKIMGEPNEGFLKKAWGILLHLPKKSEVTNLSDKEISIINEFESILQKIESNIVKVMPKLKKAKLTSRQQKAPFNDKALSPEKTFLSDITRIKREKANHLHRDVLNRLVNLLEGLGYVVEDNVYVDAYTTLVSSPAIFEVKGIAKTNELSQCRQALSQLYEYRFRHKIPDATLWLVLSEPLKQQWLIDYLMRDRFIQLIWLEEEKFSGPSIKMLFREKVK